MAWAVKWDLPVKQKITLLMLSNRINSDTGRCFPSIKGLAADCGMSETSVREALRSLKEAGIVLVHERKIEGVSLSNEYEVDLSKIPPPLRNTQAPPAPHAPPPLRHTHPNLSLKPINEPDQCEEGLFSQEDAPTADKVGMAFERFWSAYPKKTGKPEARKAFIKQAKDGIDPEVMIDGARRYADFLNSGGKGEFRPLPKYPQGWINGQRWNDADIAKAEPSEPPENRRARLLGPQFGEVVR